MTPNILCITPNPAVDRTLIVPDFVLGAVLRPQETIVSAGGKGLNVARSLRILDGASHAAGLLGGYMGRLVAHLVDQESIPATWTWFNGETRTCTILVTQEAASTPLNETTTITPADWERLKTDVRAVAGQMALACISGSLPKGTPDDAPGDLIDLLKEAGCPVWVDTSGRALANAVKAQPAAVKANGDEIGELLGYAVDDLESAVRAARDLQARGVETVVITLGKDGALLADATGLYRATPPSVQIVSAVGSGDAFFAGLVHAVTAGQDSGEALRAGVAAGTTNAMFAGGATFTRVAYDEVFTATRVQRLG